MDDNYYLLQKLVFDTFFLDSPVEIKNGVLVLDKKSRNIYLKLSLNVLEKTNNRISSVTLNIECRDDSEELIPELNPNTFVFRDIFLLKSKSFGVSNPILLNPSVRRVNVEISRVVYMDGKVWTPPKEFFNPPKQKPINTINEDLIEQLNRDTSALSYERKKRVVLIPQQLDECWLCTCGRPNTNKQLECCRCGFEKDYVFNIFNEENIQKNLEKHLDDIRLEEERLFLFKEQEQLQKEEQERKKEKERIRQDEEKRVHSKRQRTRFLLATSIVLVIVSFLVVALPAINHAKASKFLANKEYNYAIYMFYALGDFRNSKDMVKEANYQKANGLLAEQKFAESISIFSTLLDYKNSRDMLKEANYQKGIYLLEHKVDKVSYDELIMIFSGLSNYKNSEKLIKESNYQYALFLLEKQDYSSAIEIFSKLIDYKDSEEMLKESNYQYALFLFEKQDYSSAIEIFNKLIDYKDSKKQFTEAKYLKGMQLLSLNQPSDALLVFESLGDYNDSQQRVIESKYMIAKVKMSAGQYSDALSILHEIVDYKDSNDLIKQSKYHVALLDYENGRFLSAKDLFTELGNYMDSNTYNEKLNALLGIQGTWEHYMIYEGKELYSTWTFTGWKCYKYLSRTLDTEEYELPKNSIKDNTIYFEFFPDNVIYYNAVSNTLEQIFTPNGGEHYLYSKVK